jgi:Flp pilus assembly protein TadG
MNMRNSPVHPRELSSFRSIRARLKGESGTALIETSFLIGFVLVPILIGAVEFGMAFYAATEVQNAALAGVEYGAQSPSTSGDTTGIQTAATNEAANITLGTTAVSHSCICSDGSASTCLSTDCSGSHIETILTVQTQTAYTPIFQLPGLPRSYTLKGQAVQKVMQ